jgi:hypothetical protein
MIRVRRTVLTFTCSAGLLLASAGIATADLQAGRAQTPPATAVGAIVPDSFRVGDVVHAALRVRLPFGTRVQFPDTLFVSQDVEAAGSRQIRTDTVGDMLQVTALYPITAWRPGPVQLPAATIQFPGEQGRDSLVVRFDEAIVASVLPADTAAVEPRPAKDVLGGDRIWWPLLVGLAVLLALAALLIWLWRRRRPPPPFASPAPAGPSPREAALALLDRARVLRLAESGEMKRYYSLVAEALRVYMDAVEPGWGADLTTEELAIRIRSGHLVDATADAMRVLGRADLVKFARYRPDLAAAQADWALARTWVERFAEPAPAVSVDAIEPVVTA